MNDPVAQPSRFQRPQPDAVRQIQELIDKQNSDLADGLIDSDAEPCIELLKMAQTVDLHLLSEAPEMPDVAASYVDTSPRIQSWTLHYKSLLGTGGFAVVLAVDALPSGRTYAMKILRPSLRWSKDHQKRFLREAELTSLVSGPGIVPVIGTGLLRSHPFILSEHVDGPSSLSQLNFRVESFQLDSGIVS